MKTIDKVEAYINNVFDHIVVALGARAHAKVQAKGAKVCKAYSKAVDKVHTPLSAATLEDIAAERLRQATAAYNIAVEGKLQLASNLADSADDEVLQLEETLKELKVLVADTAHDLSIAKAKQRAADQHYRKTEAQVSKEKVSFI